MSVKKSQESCTYMDNVRVKIAEEYKPPPKINLIMTHTQRLTFNKQIEDNLPKYDFSMENEVLRKVREWKTSRIATRKQHQDRLEQLRATEELNEDTELGDEASPESAADPAATTTADNKTNYVTPYSNGMLLPTKVLSYYSNILQPVPLNTDTNRSSSNQVKSPFNISEFEADTSSPFDNVALKSINEVEELAKVLKIEDEAPRPSTASAVSYTNFQNAAFPNYPSNASFLPASSFLQNMNGYYNSSGMQTARSFPMSNYQQSSPPSNTYQYSSSFYNLAKNDEKVAKVSKMVPDNVPIKKSSLKTDDLPNPYDELPKNLQELVDSISSMGFPKARVARTCKTIGNDNKKILDHLLAMSELLDLGFTEDRVSEALLLHDNDRDKALDKLIS